MDDWTFKNWTSKLRTGDEHPTFTELEKNYADFTYTDRYGRMIEVLRQAGVNISPGWSSSTKFHLEVKATLGPCQEPFFVSQNQLNKVCTSKNLLFAITY